MSNDEQGRRQLRGGVPLERYVIAVDGQRKIGFPDRPSADSAAARLRSAFPVLTVVVSDQQDELIRDRP